MENLNKTNFEYLYLYITSNKDVYYENKWAYSKYFARFGRLCKSITVHTANQIRKNND